MYYAYSMAKTLCNMDNVLDISSREEFRKWLTDNSKIEKECYIKLKRGKPILDDVIYYIDAVEEAICFGWIDSTLIKINGESYNRFSPRSSKTSWTELNKERVRRLEKLGLMTDEGRNVLPDMGPRSFKIDPEIVEALKNNRCFKTFKSFPPLYQRVRASNLSFYKRLNKDAYEKALKHFINETKKKNMYGMWNDFGRLLNY